MEEVKDTVDALRVETPSAPEPIKFDEDIIELHLKVNRITGEFEFLKKTQTPQDTAIVQMLMNCSVNMTAQHFFKPKQELIAKIGGPGGLGVANGIKSNMPFFKKHIR